MELDKYQQAWKAEGAQMRVTIDAGRLSKAVEESHGGFQSTIFRRDCVEVGTALVMLPVWFYMGISASLPWTWWLSVPAFIWVAGFILVDRKRHPQRPSEAGEPLAFYAKEALTQVEHQIWLLRNVFWWYLLPFSISIMAFFLHVSWRSSSAWWGFLLSAGFSGLFLLVIYGGIYRLNQYAVRKQLEPRRQDLLKLVVSLDDASDDNSDTMADLVSAFEDPARSGGFSGEIWAENWNQLVPSWRMAAVIILPTLTGALCGLWSGLCLRIPEMGPVFFQTVVGAVIPFEIVFFSRIYLIYRRKTRQSASENSQLSVSANDLNAPQPVNQKPARLPAAPAMLILVLISLFAILAILAVFSFFFSFSASLKVSTSTGREPSRTDTSVEVSPAEIPEATIPEATVPAVETEGPVNETVTMLAEVCRKHDIPAVAIAVVNSDGLVESECYGIRRRGESEKVQIFDRFAASGCTASMTATLAAVLVDADRIEWDTTIGDVWSSDPELNIHSELREVTLEDLLTHQSGLAGNISDISPTAWGSFFDEQQSPTLERKRMLRLVLDKQPPQPRRTFAHSNLGYAVASAMLETRTGEPFETLMKKHVFNPLEMHSADFHSIRKSRDASSTPWGHAATTGNPVDPQSAGAENPTVYAAVGTVHLSIADCAKYAAWHLAGKPAPLLQSQEVFDHLHKPIVDDSSSGARYGCCWIGLDTQHGPALTRGGSNTNSFAVIRIYPESDFAAVAFTNTGERAASFACNDLIHRLELQHAAKQTSPSELQIPRISQDRQ